MVPTPLEFRDCLTDFPLFGDILARHEGDLECSLGSMDRVLKEMKKVLKVAKLVSL